MASGLRQRHLVMSSLSCGILLLSKQGHHLSLQSLPSHWISLTIHLSLLLTSSCRTAAEKDTEPWTSGKLTLPNFQLNLVHSELVSAFISHSWFQRATVPKLCTDSQDILNFWGKHSDICWTPCEQLLLFGPDHLASEVFYFLFCFVFFCFDLEMPWKFSWNTKGTVNQETGEPLS